MRIGSALFLVAALLVGTQTVRAGEGGRPVGSPIGSCCEPDGVCRLTTEIDCYQGGGIAWTEGEDCAGDCGQAGGCCLPEGTCAFLLEEACVENDGVFRGPGADCDGEECLSAGRRCYVSLNPPIWYCLRSKAQCDRISGAWTRGEICALNGHGACCLPTGTCEDLEMQSCLEQGGVYQGDGTVCDVAACNPHPTGSCCMADGTCEVLTEDACFSSGGVNWNGFGTCESQSCPAAGACCLFDGTCVVVEQLACENLEGSFYGEGHACQPETCGPVPVELRSWGSIKSRYR